QISELTKIKGSSRSLWFCSALKMPPAVSSGSSPSSDQCSVTPYSAPSPNVCISLSASHEALIVISVIPAACSALICQTISGCPPTSTKGFGVSSVSGRRRVPLPAAKIIACVITDIHAPCCWLYDCLLFIIDCFKQSKSDEYCHRFYFAHAV